MMKTYLLKAEERDLARWKAQAEEAGVAFAVWVRDALDSVGEFVSTPQARQIEKPPVEPVRARAQSSVSGLKNLGKPPARDTRGCFADTPKGTKCKFCLKVH